LRSRARHALHWLPASLLAASCLLGCSRVPEPPPFKPVADMKLLMTAVIDPGAAILANTLAASTGEDGSENPAPPSEEQWTAVRNAAVALAESGNLLMLAPRARDSGDWMREARALIDIGESALAAAQARDANQISEITDRLYGVCSECHQKYPPAAVPIP
jgi:hypothetical protein